LQSNLSNLKNRVSQSFSYNFPFNAKNKKNFTRVRPLDASPVLVKKKALLKIKDKKDLIFYLISSLKEPDKKPEVFPVTEVFCSSCSFNNLACLRYTI
jgi:hypothetical protein